MNLYFDNNHLQELSKRVSSDKSLMSSLKKHIIVISFYNLLEISQSQCESTKKIKLDFLNTMNLKYLKYPDFLFNADFHKYCGLSNKIVDVLDPETLNKPITSDVTLNEMIESFAQGNDPKKDISYWSEINTEIASGYKKEEYWKEVERRCNDDLNDTLINLKIDASRHHERYLEVMNDSSTLQSFRICYYCLFFNLRNIGKIMSMSDIWDMRQSESLPWVDCFLSDRENISNIKSIFRQLGIQTNNKLYSNLDQFIKNVLCTEQKKSQMTL